MSDMVTCDDMVTSKMVTSEKIQQLDQRHTQLIDELDTLNERLEQVLNSFSKSNETQTLEVR